MNSQPSSSSSSCSFFFKLPIKPNLPPFFPFAFGASSSSSSASPFLTKLPTPPPPASQSVPGPLPINSTWLTDPPGPLPHSPELDREGTISIFSNSTLNHLAFTPPAGAGNLTSTVPLSVAAGRGFVLCSEEGSSSLGGIPGQPVRKSRCAGGRRVIRGAFADILGMDGQEVKRRGRACDAFSEGEERARAEVRGGADVLTPHAWGLRGCVEFL